MDLQLQNKMIVVTGGAKGIGYGIVKQLAKEGAIPVIVGRNNSDNEQVVDELKSMELNAYHFVAELSDPQECRRVINAIIKSHGRIDGLVNNAGLNDGVSLENGNYDDFIKSLHRNLVHYYLITHYALPELKKSNGPILNISSKVADVGQGNTSAYAASNGARNALTREWAVELLKYGLRVNAIVVGECWTPQYASWIKTLPDSEKALEKITSKIPLGNRMTTIDEIADTALFLLSPRSSHTTGQLIYIDGGYVHLDRALLNSSK